MTIAGLNSLDLILVLMLFVGVMIGFVRGAVSQIISLVSIWLGLVATLWLYKLLSDYIFQDVLIDFDIGETGSDVLAFILLLAVFFVGFRLLVKYLAVPPEERKKKRKQDVHDPLAEAARTTSQRVAGCFNAIGGMGMGFILTILWLTLLLGVLQFIFQPTETAVPYVGFAGGLVSNMRTSSLMPWFNYVLLGLFQSLRLFIPQNADIFEVVLSKLVGTAG
jgi:uncharacterized membrane protein required for colicin V production